MWIFGSTFFFVYPCLFLKMVDSFLGCYLRLIFSISSREMCVNFFMKIGGKIAIFIFHTSTLPHKNVCRFVVCPKKHSENTLPKNGRFLGVSGVDIIIYIVYIIFFRRYMPLTLFFVWKCGSVDFCFWGRNIKSC